MEVCILVSIYMGCMETAFTVNPKPFKKIALRAVIKWQVASVSAKNHVDVSYKGSCFMKMCCALAWEAQIKPIIIG